MPVGHLIMLCGTYALQQYWDKGAGNSRKAPQKSELKLEFTRADVFQERGERPKAKGTAGAGTGSEVEGALWSQITKDKVSGRVRQEQL